MGSEWGSPPCLSLSGGRCSIETPAFPKVAFLEEQKDFSVHSDTWEGRKEGRRDMGKGRREERREGYRYGRKDG